MGSRSLALVVLLGVLGLVALAAHFALGRGPGATAPDAEPEAASSGSSAEVERAEPRIVATPVDEGRSELPVARPDSTASAAAGTPETETLLLEVIDGRTNAPAPDVRVRYAIVEQPRERKCLARGMRLSNPKARTDAQGLARLAVTRAKGVEVVAEHAGFVGEATYAARAADEAGERRERLVLLRDWDLAVEVLDDQRQPASGVPLRLSSDALGRASADRVFTDGTGAAPFRHAGHERHQVPGGVLRGPAARPRDEDDAASVAREPPQPVRLVLPPLGSIEVEVLAADGAPAEEDTSVSLRLMRPGESGPAPIAWGRSTPTTSRPARSGRALFERVPLGQRFELTVVRDPERARTVVAGPERSGERVQATLRLALEDALLTFRALDPAGQPIATSLAVNVLCGSDGSWGSSGRSSEDPDGTFQVQLEPALNEGDRRALEVSAREGSLSARVDLSRLFPPGRTDMGDVVLAPTPLVAEGRVVDAEGRPVAGVSVSWWIAPEDAKESSWGAQRFGSEHQETDAQGRFALHGVVQAQRVSLRVLHARLHSDPIDVAVGARDVEIVVRGTGGLAGRALLDPGVPLERIIRVSGSSGGHSAKFRSDGSFDFHDLPAGKTTLSVVVDDEVLLEVPDLEVVPGEITRDPRIQEIDLRGRLRVFRIRLVTPTPNDHPRWSLSWSASGVNDEERSKMMRSYGESGVVLVTTLARVDATLRVEGYRPEHLVDLAPETEVHLRTGYAVRLALPAGARLPEPPLFLGIALGGAEPDQQGDVGYFDERGEALVHVSEAGRASVRWILDRRARNSFSQERLDDPSGSTLFVEDRPDEQRIELAITPDGLAALLRSR